jgi:rhodanese-related sulfurtransferase
MPTPEELRVSFEEFKKLYDRGEVLVVDVRSAESYQAGHIPGAISVPLDAVEARIPELKKEKRAIVTYCT